MRHWKLFAASAIAALALPAAALADGTTGQDRANGARACKALQKSMGATFGDTYSTFGSCVSKWTQEAHTARHAALKLCKAQGKRGKALATCASKKTTATLTAKQRTTDNAAASCDTERTALGEEAFATKYGENENDRNAFGKCVSGKVSKRPAPAQAYTVTFGQVDGSGVTGRATLVLKGTQLTVRFQASGLEGGKEHMAHIHGIASGDLTCSASTAGDVLVPLTPYETANNGGNLSFSGTYTIDLAKVGPLDLRTINIHGKTINGVYNAGAVVACGEIAAR